MSKEFLRENWLDLPWSCWIPLEIHLFTLQQKHIPTEGGLYRVRVVGQEKLAYIGQTGRNLRERLRALSINTYREKENPPWNDPHTGAPGLWAWCIEEGYSYEISAVSLKLGKEERECFEDMLLFQYRQEERESTLCNHGRFHPLWTRPSNRKNGRVMQRLQKDEHHSAGGPSLSPVLLCGEPHSHYWLGLDWSPKRKLSGSNIFPACSGVYRLFHQEEVAYLGQSSSLSNRLL